jgi:hypothetical protein
MKLEASLISRPQRSDWRTRKGAAQPKPPRAGLATWPAVAVANMLLGLALTGCGPDSSGKGPQLPPSASLGRAGAVEHASAATNAAAAVPESMFHADLASGRDPFYPGASRGQAKSGPASAPQLPLASYLKLVGIRSGTTRPLALINRTTFAPGEEGEVSVVVPNTLGHPEVQRINVRCLEIRRDCVVVSIAGEEGTRELHMGQPK